MWYWKDLGQALSKVAQSGNSYRQIKHSFNFSIWFLTSIFFSFSFFYHTELIWKRGQLSFKGRSCSKHPQVLVITAPPPLPSEICPGWWVWSVTNPNGLPGEPFSCASRSHFLAKHSFSGRGPFHPLVNNPQPAQSREGCLSLSSFST